MSEATRHPAAETKETEPFPIDTTVAKTTVSPDNNTLPEAEGILQEQIDVLFLSSLYELYDELYCVNPEQMSDASLQQHIGKLWAYSQEVNDVFFLTTYRDSSSLNALWYQMYLTAREAPTQRWELDSAFQEELGELLASGLSSGDYTEDSLQDIAQRLPTPTP